MKSVFISAVASLLLFMSCDKDSGDINAGDTGSIVLEFDNVVGENDLQLNTATYTNGSGEEFTISTLNYYISNLKLKTSNGTEYIVPQDESYFLIKEEEESTHAIELHNVPAGDYTSFTFTVGVDSMKNTTLVGQRSGVLDPIGQGSGMFWDHNSGYIFLRMDGSSPASTEPDNKISYHIGGFGGYNSPTMNNIKTLTITAPFESSAKVRKETGHAPQVHIFADAAKILDGSTHISIATNPIVHFVPLSADIANNYADMFNVDHIHND